MHEGTDTNSFIYKIVNVLLPNYLYSHLEFPSNNHDPLRSALTSKLLFILSPTKTFKMWNNIINGISLKPKIKSPESIQVFKKAFEKDENFIFCSSSSQNKTNFTSQITI